MEHTLDAPSQATLATRTAGLAGTPGEQDALHTENVHDNTAEPSVPGAPTAVPPRSVSAFEGLADADETASGAPHPHAALEEAVMEKIPGVAAEQLKPSHNRPAHGVDTSGATPNSPTTPVEAAASDPEPYGAQQFSMKDLFGAFFHLDEVPTAVADPSLMDTRTMLQTHFGEFVQEADIEVLDTASLMVEMRANKAARDQAQVEQLFGVAGTHVLSKDAVEDFAVLRSSVPERDAELLYVDPKERPIQRDGATAEAGATGTQQRLWLVEMPKMMPNRQTLHADPQPFFPSSCPLLENDDRALYTPHNILRWTHHKSSDTYMSNARVVRWSDGSCTLHVGSDTYSLQPARSNAAVHLLGHETSVSKGGVSLPSLTKTLNPDKHFVVESTEAASIERAVVAESANQLTKMQRVKLAYASVPLPDVDWSRPKATRNPYEEFVAMEYVRRDKELIRRLKDGRPMSLREQLEEDTQLLRELNTTDVDELVERQKEEKRQAALLAARRSQLTANGARAAGRSRLDRDLGLTSDGLGGDPFVSAAPDGEDESGGSSEGSESGGDDEYERMLGEMERKREREGKEEEAQRRQRATRVEEQDAARRYAPLLTSLEAVAKTLPMGSDAYGEAEGMVDFMRAGSFTSSLIETEVASVVRSIESQVPDCDLSAVRAAYSALFPSASL